MCITTLNINIAMVYPGANTGFRTGVILKHLTFLHILVWAQLSSLMIFSFVVNTPMIVASQSSVLILDPGEGSMISHDQYNYMRYLAK